MSKFEKAVKLILKHEGGYVNDPVDPGGATNYGISLRFLKGTGDLDLGDIDGDGDIDKRDIKKMKVEEATKIYKRYWWDKYNYEKINSAEVGTKIFDMSVNMGGKQAHKLAQRACNDLGSHLADDGVLGPLSFHEINSYETEEMVEALRKRHRGFYEYLIKKKPQFEKYRRGWMRRANA